MSCTQNIFRSQPFAFASQSTQAERLKLTGRDSVRVLELLDNPPAPNARLLAAARRLPA
jgi:uncharacterized protein (DUF1778 family)